MRPFSGRDSRRGGFGSPLHDLPPALWTPRIGDVFPDFVAQTTEGPLALHDWAGGGWVVLFSHPAAFSSVCSTEIVSFAEAMPDFRAMNTRIMGVTGSCLSEQLRWQAELERMFGTDCSDLTAAVDSDGTLLELFGATGPGGTAPSMRKTFILDPGMRVRMVFEYPAEVGRSVEEILRCLAALQVTELTGLSTPADWEPGQDFVADGDMPRDLHGAEVTRIAPYLTVINGRLVRQDPAPRRLGEPAATC
ncbi:redoxin domain-containing protein [Roseivivax sp. CAU 1761]